MTINDLCERYGHLVWAQDALRDFLIDQPERYRSRPSKRVLSEGFYEQIDWLVHQCEPPYTLEQIDDYFVDCLAP